MANESERIANWYLVALVGFVENDLLKPYAKAYIIREYDIDEVFEAAVAKLRAEYKETDDGFILEDGKLFSPFRTSYSELPPPMSMELERLHLLGTIEEASKALQADTERSESIVATLPQTPKIDIIPRHGHPKKKDPEKK